MIAQQGMPRQADGFVIAAAVACLAACVGDFAVTFLLGLRYPRYDPLRHVMSRLGAADSPVAFWMNAWWIVYGLLMVLFAAGLSRAFPPGRAAVYILVGQIVALGLFAGIGAGLFPMDSPGAAATRTGRLHNAVGGVGFLAISVAPLVSLWVFPRAEFAWLHWLAWAAQAGGIVTFVLFVVSNGAPGRGVLACAGLWQRLFLLAYYVHLSAIAFVMLRGASPRPS